MRTNQASNPFSKRGVIAYALVVLLFAAAYWCAFSLNDCGDKYRGISYRDDIHHFASSEQYDYLADALIHGRVDLDLPVAPELAALANPYDFEARNAIGSQDVPMFWDHAFYQGKYYCYFGVVPAVFAYVPFRLATGTGASTPAVVCVLGVLAILAAGLLVHRIGRRYFYDSATTLSLGVCLFVFYTGCSFPYLGFVSLFYSVPILGSLLCTMLGLWFWLGADCSGRQSGAHVGAHAAAGGSLSVWRLAAGSAFMALNLGCRPQFMLFCLLAFPLFKDKIFETRELFSVSGFRATVAALAPFAVVIVPLLAYNQVRFGSPFDFGSSYNLTGFDMTSYHQPLKLTGVLVLTFLFQPWDLSTSFPFVETTANTFPDLGWAPSEPFFGGYFFLMPLQCAALLFPVVGSTLKRRGLLGATVLCLLFAAVVLVFDVRSAGITQRYFSDFGPYISLAACFVILSFQDKLVDNIVARRIGIACVALAIVVTVAVGLCTLFSPDRFEAVYRLRPELYDQVKGLFG